MKKFYCRAGLIFILILTVMQVQSQRLNSYYFEAGAITNIRKYDFVCSGNADFRFKLFSHIRFLRMGGGFEGRPHSDQFYSFHIGFAPKLRSVYYYNYSTYYYRFSVDVNYIFRNFDTRGVLAPQLNFRLYLDRRWSLNPFVRYDYGLAVSDENSLKNFKAGCTLRYDFGGNNSYRRGIKAKF